MILRKCCFGRQDLVNSVATPGPSIHSTQLMDVELNNDVSSAVLFMVILSDSILSIPGSAECYYPGERQASIHTYHLTDNI